MAGRCLAHGPHLRSQASRSALSDDGSGGPSARRGHLRSGPRVAAPAGRPWRTATYRQVGFCENLRLGGRLGVGEVPSAIGRLRHVHCAGCPPHRRIGVGALDPAHPVRSACPANRHPAGRSSHRTRPNTIRQSTTRLSTCRTSHDPEQSPNRQPGVRGCRRCTAPGSARGSRRDGRRSAQRCTPGIRLGRDPKHVGYPGIKTAQWALEHADARAESPLETLGRHSFLSAGLPPPLSNVWMRTDATWFRVDHLIPSTGVILEADGAVKYNNRPDADAIVRSEKERERLLRQAGFAVGRYSWSDAVNAPRTIPSRAAQAGRSRPPGSPPTCWTLEPPARTNSLTPFT